MDGLKSWAKLLKFSALAKINTRKTGIESIHIQGDEEADKIDEKNIAELDREKKERIERDNANIQRVDAQTKKYF